MLLNQFNYTIEYIPGHENVIPDALSRGYEQSSSIAAITESLANLGTIDLVEVVAGNFITVLPSDDEWAKEQHKDSQLYPLIRYLEHAELPEDDEYALTIIKKADKFVLQGEYKILAIVNKVEQDDTIETVQKVVLATWRRLIMSQYHDSMFKGAHSGRDKTLQKIKANFYFYNLADYVDLYVKTCHVCQRIKDPNSKSWALLGHIECLRPFDLVSFDIWSPGTVSIKGNKCVLTVIDGFSKWAAAIPLPNHEAITVARALHDLQVKF